MYSIVRTQNMLVLLCFVLVLSYVQANCDVYKQTMDSVDFWHNYDFEKGSLLEAGEELYTDDGKVTFSTSSGSVTLPWKKFFERFNFDNISKMKVAVRNIDCAFDGGWCHLQVFTTYYSSTSGETVSLPAYWTYFYDPVTCKWAHYVILQHSNDLDYMIDVLSSSSPAGMPEEL